MTHGKYTFHAGWALSRLLLFSLLLLPFFPSVVQAQMINRSYAEDFSRIAINKSAGTHDVWTPFSMAGIVSGICISGHVHFYSDTALVRVILTDQSGREYLVYESYPRLSGSTDFSIDSTADETFVMDQVTPVSIRFELTDADFYLHQLFVRKGTVNPQLKSIQQQRQSDRIKLLNRHIQERGEHWLAGETQMSSFSFQEKMEMFGGKIPNFQGFEYYSGGIFPMPGTMESKALADRADDSLYVPEFSWRNRHGQDWVTPVKNQWTCGSCWAFAAAGAMELLINLYFNNHIDYDLSEQELVSCVYGNCVGGSTGKGLAYIQNIGLVDEACFPYVSKSLNCREVCKSSPGRVVITNYRWYNPQRENLKKFLIRGPVALSIGPWNHAMVLVGYRVIREGDKLYQRFDSKDQWVTVQAGDPLIGKTCWQVKNSWGPYFGEKGYANILLNMNDVISTYCLDGKPLSAVFSDADVKCTDNDHDGYYTWGLGQKPAGCPVSPDLPDGDDTNPCAGPMDEYGRMMSVSPLPPVAEDVLIPVGSPVTPLHAEGTNVRWYADSSLALLLAEGNNYEIHDTAGLFTYYVTQGNGICNSKAGKVELRIMIPSPVTENVTICEGNRATLTARGRNIRWYKDPAPVLIDRRDGKTYKTVVISGQKWMSQNLSIKLPGSVFYMNDSLHYKAYGRFYTWQMALDACPAGWNIPTDNQFRELEKNLGMTRQEINKTGEFRGTTEGNKLKEPGTVHWTFDSGATDETGLNLIPGGYALTGFNEYDLNGQMTFLWTRTSVARTTYAMNRMLGAHEGGILRTNMQKNNGLSIRCIADTLNLQLADTGESFTPLDTLPGLYNYYVSQEIGGLESDRKRVSLKIDPVAFNNLPDSLTICSGMRLPALTNPGEFLYWFDDASLTHRVYPANQEAGEYTYYVVMENFCGTSDARRIHLDIKPLPVFSLGGDTTLEWEEKLTLHPGDSYMRYTWNNGSTTPFYETEGQDLGSGTHFIRLMVIDSNQCAFADTLLVTVQHATSIPVEYEGNLRVYPNPGKGIYKVVLPGSTGPVIHVSVSDINGKILMNKDIRLFRNGETITLDLSRYANGIYILRLEDLKKVQVVRVVKK